MKKIVALFTVLLLGLFLVATAQTRSVTGTVTDAIGNGVPFASVKVKGSRLGTSADANGAYSLKVASGATLVFSSIGFDSKEMLVTGNVMNASLVRNTTNLSEVVVTTALGIKRQPKELGYSTVKINSDELTQAKGTNIATGLAAKVSGLQINLVNNSVKPDVRITLRGNRSILGNNQALLVVDDIQLPISYLASLNPDDVDNATVLKGGSASALYGSAASNGVIIITTKKGSRGKPKVTFSSTVNLENIAYTPDFQNTFGQYGGENDPSIYPGLIYFPGNPYFPYVPYENQNYGPRFNGQKVPIGAPIRVYKPDGSFSIKQDSTTYSAMPDAKKNFFNTGVTTINNVSYSAGDEKSRFFFSFDDNNAKGVLPKDVSRRNSIRLNGSKESGIFRVDYNFGYSITHTNTTAGSGVPFSYGTSGFAGGYAGGGSYFQNRPVYWQIINQPANIDFNRYRNWQTDPFSNPDGYFNAYYGNVWWQIDQTRLDEKKNDLIGNVALGLKPLSWLDLQYKVGIARDDYSNKYTQAGYNFAAWAIADTFNTGNIASSVKKFSPNEGDALSYNQRLTNDFIIATHNTFGDFNIKGFLGTSLIDNNVRIITTSASALVVPDFYNISNRVGEPSVAEVVNRTRTLGAFADVTGGYKGYLFLHGSLRKDWTSILSKANRSYLYPAVDAAFVFTDAIKSLRDNKFISFGKIRAAYSRTAQVSIGAYALQNTFNTGSGFPFGNIAGFSVNGTYANPDIKPEFSTDKEIGLELGLLHNKINLQVAYYNTLTNNQTIPITISNATGFSSALVNSGEMSNKGIEVDVKINRLVQTKDFSWDIGGNFSYNENKVVSLGYGLPEVGVGGNSFATIGQSYPVLKLNDWKRDPQGRIIINPNTGYPTPDAALKYFGTTNPPYKVGLTTTLNYKGFTLNAVADGRFGATIYNGAGPSLDFTGVSAYSASSGRQPFVIPNSSYFDATKNQYVPNANYNTQDGNLSFWASTWNTVQSNYVNSADFWKLREVTLTYTFSPQVLKGLKYVNALTIGVVGRNLVVIKAKENVWSDPEFANTTGNGIGTTDINQLPPTRFYGFNVTVTF